MSASDIREFLRTKSNLDHRENEWEEEKRCEKQGKGDVRARIQIWR